MSHVMTYAKHVPMQFDWRQTISLAVAKENRSRGVYGFYEQSTRSDDTSINEVACELQQSITWLTG